VVLIGRCGAQKSTVIDHGGGWWWWW